MPSSSTYSYASSGSATTSAAAATTREMAERLARSAEVAAVSGAGAELRVLMPEKGGEADEDAPTRDDAPQLHLRPASVEHLLAVESLWPRMDAADRQVLSSCYTPRDTPHTQRLTTLYVPLSDGMPHAAGEAESAPSAARRLRPLRLHELQELLRIYVVRAPQPAAATLALPLAPAGDARAHELRTHEDEDVLCHVYCTLAPPSGAGTAYVLQMTPATQPEASPSPSPDPLAATPALVDLCQSGSLQEALQAVALGVRPVGLTSPSLAVSALTSAVASAQKAKALSAETVQAAQQELLLAAAPPAPSAGAAALGTTARGGAGSKARSHTQRDHAGIALA